jgi:hypothetical protein
MLSSGWFKPIHSNTTNVNNRPLIYSTSSLNQVANPNMREAMDIHHHAS